MTRTVDGIEVPPFYAWNEQHKNYVLNNLRQSLYKGRYMIIDCFENDVTAFYTTRFDGVSKAPYDSFNMALHVGDNEADVLANRKTMNEDFGLEHTCFMNQTHSADVIVVDESNRHQDCFDCDALVTSQKKTAIAVMTADCLPLILCDEENNVCAAIHCGWRGIAGGIIENSVHAMEKLGASTQSIRGFLGPAIGPHSFEIGAEVREQFLKKDEGYQDCFMVLDHTDDKGNPKYLCHIYRLAVNTLRSLGVDGPIFGGRADTFMQTSVFYSYRKASVTGRMASVICLN